MLEVGHEFKRKSSNYCVIDKIIFNNKTYLLLSVENPNDKLNFVFYECYQTPNNNKLKIVSDENTIMSLLDLLEKGE